MKMKLLSYVIALLFIANFVNAQCEFDPTITGEVILCPDTNSTLSTQEYDEYQWYRRGFSDTDATPIDGETSQTLQVNNPEDVLFYFSVEATLDGCTEFSPEVLLDGWVFIPVTVASTGDFTVGNNGQSIVCEGDTMYFTINSPYNTNITWYKDGNPIIGDTTPILTVTTSGEYTVTGAPDICPDYVQSLGLILEVDVIECGTTVDENHGVENIVDVYPNPANNQLQVKSEEEIHNIHFYNSFGQKRYSENILSKQKTIDITDFEKGMYFMEINTEHNLEVHKVIIQ